MPEPLEHTRDDLWQEVNRTKSDLSDLRADVSSISTRIGNVENSLTRIESALSRPRNVNWTGIGSLVIAIIAIAATYIQARLSPIEKEIADSQAFDGRSLDNILEISEAKGASIKDREHLRDLLARLESSISQGLRDQGATAILAHRNEARLDALEADVDQQATQNNDDLSTLKLQLQQQGP